MAENEQIEVLTQGSVEGCDCPDCRADRRYQIDQLDEMPEDPR